MLPFVLALIWLSLLSVSVCLPPGISYFDQCSDGISGDGVLSIENMEAHDNGWYLVNMKIKNEKCLPNESLHYKIFHPPEDSIFIMNWDRERRCDINIVHAFQFKGNDTYCLPNFGFTIGWCVTERELLTPACRYGRDVYTYRYLCDAKTLRGSSYCFKYDDPNKIGSSISSLESFTSDSIEISSTLEPGFFGNSSISEPGLVSSPPATETDITSSTPAPPPLIPSVSEDPEPGQITDPNEQVIITETIDEKVTTVTLEQGAVIGTNAGITPTTKTDTTTVTGTAAGGTSKSTRTSTTGAGGDEGDDITVVETIDTVVVITSNGAVTSVKTQITRSGTQSLSSSTFVGEGNSITNAFYSILLSVVAVLLAI